MSDMSLFNKNNTTWKHGNYSLFLGESPALLDSINVSYPKLFDLYKLQKSMDWSEDEVNLEQSRLDLINTGKNNYDIMIKTLAFQWELDSVASRAIAPLFAPFVTNSELWLMLSKQSEIENLHALTYSEIIRQCLPDPKDVFAEVMLSDEVLERSEKVVEVFNNLYKVGGLYKTGVLSAQDNHDIIVMKESIALALVALYCLEKIEFMASFACTFALAEQNIFQGIAKLVQKIAQDEQCVTADHQVLTTDGWKFISDVTIEDKVAQWDHPTNEIQFVNPSRVLKKLYTGEMYTLKSGSLKRVNQVVTDKHRIPVINPYSHSNREFVYAEDYKSSGASSIPVSGLLIQECPPLSALERFYIAFQADGTMSSDPVRNGKHTGCKVMIFNFKKERKLEGMLSILEELGFEYTYHENEDVRKDGDVYHVFRVSVPLEYFIDGMKDFGWIDYSKIDHIWIRSFINELIIWDSYTNRDGYYTYINTNKLAIDVVQTLCHLGGHKTTLITTKAHSRIIADGIEINAKECYRLSIFLDIAYQGGQCMVKTSDHVENLDVYCLTVPSSYFLVKRDGQISVTGNCHVMMDESIIDILLTDEVDIWGSVFESIKPQIKEVIDSVVRQELSWNNYLFSDGRSIVGLNETLLKEWVIYNAQPVYAKFGLKCEYTAVVNNPLVWMNNWLDLNKTQNANQEADNTNYRLNSVVDDANEEIFEL